MGDLLTTRGALLQMLLEGPGYGLDLIRRLEERAATRVSEARVYPVLKELEAGGLVQGVPLAPKGRRGGRARTYYHLTARGQTAAQADRKVLRDLLTPHRSPITDQERLRMAERILEGEELAESALELRSAGRR